MIISDGPVASSLKFWNKWSYRINKKLSEIASNIYNLSNFLTSQKKYCFKYTLHIALDINEARFVSNRNSIQYSSKKKAQSDEKQALTR